MHVAIQIAISVAAAFAFDWALHFQAGLFQGIATDGRRPAPYRLPRPTKIALIILYLVPLNIMIHYKMRDFNLWWIVLAVTLAAYIVYVSASAQRPPEDSGRGR